MNFLGIVPARGGSRGVVRKNMRPLDGSPLLAYTVAAAIESGVIDRLVVSSDDQEILAWASLRSHETILRPSYLASHEATISDVAVDIVERLGWHGGVVLLQPTSPLRSGDSIRQAVEAFRSSGCDSLSTAVREPHLYWLDRTGDLDQAEPLFTERRNRQFMRHPVLRESGAIQIVHSDALLSSRSVVGQRHRLFELGGDEAIDIDTFDDYAAVRRRREQGTVVFRLRANSVVGSGHLFHCLRLAEELADQSLHFLLKDCDAFAGDTLERYGYEYSHERGLDVALEHLRAPRGQHLIVNDVLDTTAGEVLAARRAGYLVVNIEDLGTGAEFADWVVNALYPANDRSPRPSATGAAYATLRSEFMDLPPKEIVETGSRVLLTFGGTDPGNLSARVAHALRSRLPNVDLRVIVGPGASEPNLPAEVGIERTVDSMAAAMLDADLVVTSAGRTVYEAAAVGAPVVVLAQNAREATHAHLGYDTGVVFLGIAPLVDDDHLAATVDRLLSDRPLRQELSERLRNSIDHRGAERIAWKIRAILWGLN